MTDGLLRQRRNLLILSLILLFLKQGQAVISPALSISGANLKLANPVVIYEGIWIAFFYLNLRYFQYFIADGLEKLRSVWNHNLDKEARPQVQEYVGAQMKLKGIVGFEFNMPMFHVLEKNALFTWKFMKHHIRFPSEADVVYKADKVPDILVPVSVVVIPHLKALWKTIFISTVFSDYALPILLAFFALTFCSLNDWNGGLINILSY